MKGFYRIIASIITLMAVIFIGVNLTLFFIFHEDNGRSYRVEINRLQNEISEKGLEQVDIKKYSSIIKVTESQEDNPAKTFFEGEDSDYVIRYINGCYYRFDYEVMLSKQYRVISLSTNTAMSIMAAVVLFVLIYIRNRLLKPFHKIKEVPYELSKGNLTLGLKENKNRYFGRFVWGLDMLREKLEMQKKKELALLKEKKTLVLSISHDIKTPLSAINLYSKALSKNLYDSDEKRTQIAEQIGEKVKEIETLVTEIMKASSEDFLNLEVHNTEFYLTDVLDHIEDYYKEKLSLLKTEFLIEPYDNCLLRGDYDRVVEVIQNIMENAIKYGDGRYIHIDVTAEEDVKLIRIVNSGCTLKAHELPHIFESFWRGSNASNNNGSGLGLYICRQLMKQMDGSIYADCKTDEMLVTLMLRRA